MHWRCEDRSVRAWQAQSRRIASATPKPRMKKPLPLRLPAGLAALRERNFVLYVAGQFTSRLGDWIELTAVSWILYELTGSPLLLGLSGLFRAAPMIVLALFGGAIADRVSRRPLLMFTELTMLIASLIVGLLALNGALQFWHLYILNVLSGTLSAFSVPSRQALFAGLVPRSAMQSAVTWNSLAVRGGRLDRAVHRRNCVGLRRQCATIFYQCGEFSRYPVCARRHAAAPCRRRDFIAARAVGARHDRRRRRSSGAMHPSESSWAWSSSAGSSDTTARSSRFWRAIFS